MLQWDWYIFISKLLEKKKHISIVYASISASYVIYKMSSFKYLAKVIYMENRD